MIITLRITGMTCKRCVSHVDAALRSVPGVTAVQVDLPSNTAKVSCDPEQSPASSLVAAVQQAGYDVVQD